MSYQLTDYHRQKETTKPIYWQMADHHYLTLWDAKDIPKVEKIQQQIRLTHNETLILDFFDIMNKKWNDHNYNNLNLEPHKVSRKDDILTYKGIARMLRIVTGQDQPQNRGFKYVAVGTAGGSTVYMPFSDSIQSEERAVAFDLNGFFDAAGTSIRYGGTFDQSMPTETYSSSLVRTTANQGDSGMVCLCLNNFAEDPIDHTQGNTGFTSAGSIELTIIAD